jgi:hypothetical protein
MAKRKTFKRKATAKAKARGRTVYKVKAGWRLGRKSKSSSRRRRRSWP